MRHTKQKEDNSFLIPWTPTSIKKKKKGKKEEEIIEEERGEGTLMSFNTKEASRRIAACQRGSTLRLYSLM